MSTQQHKADSSLNNLPEKNASKSATGGTSTDPTGAIGSNKSVPTSTDDTNAQATAPVDRHGDTWGGGIPFENKQHK